VIRIGSATSSRAVRMCSHRLFQIPRGSRCNKQRSDVELPSTNRAVRSLSRFKILRLDRAEVPVHRRTGHEPSLTSGSFPVTMKIFATILEAQEIERILAHLGLQANALPRAPQYEHSFI
jgi:hypothetical protein